MLAHLPQAAHVAEAFILLLPQRRQLRAQHLLRRLRLRRYLGGRLGERYTPVDPGPPAPPELVVQTSLPREREIEEIADPEGYFAGGYLGTLMHLETAERFGFDLSSAQAVLDFGCGAAKNIRLLRGIRDLRLVGTDVNATQIKWARKHVPGVEFHVNEPEPPLRFAEDDTFDLVTAASVFTHIPVHLQRPWLEEIRRILRPGGYFVFTVAGAHHIHIQLSYATKAAGSWDVFQARVEVLGSSWDMFQTREEVLGSCDSMFEVLDYSASESTQDTLVLRKQ
jgi:2-polyprenyl-3-methyl-5-hydroxy-6-metoxy-1,4-benzoquinol methylase